MKMTKKILFLTLIAALVFAACAKPPTEEMNNATAAVTKAENDPDAKAYAQNSIARAKDMLNNMRTEAEQKHYDQAKQIASDVIALADRAITEGKNAAQRMRDDAANAIRAMEAALTETQATIEAARTAKQRGVNFNEIDNDYNTATALADQARFANNSNNYRQAIDNSQAVRNQLSNISAKIAQAAQALSRKK